MFDIFEFNLSGMEMRMLNAKNLDKGEVPETNEMS
jgi:hypothetical protein